MYSVNYVVRDTTKTPPDGDVLQIKDGSVLVLDQLPKEFSFKADVTVVMPQSVIMEVIGPVNLRKVEQYLPYVQAGDFISIRDKLVPGVYTLKLTLCSDTQGTVPIETQTISNVKIIDTVNLGPKPIVINTTTDTTLILNYNDIPQFKDGKDKLVELNWDWGDGNLGAGVVDGHVYTSPDTYNAVVKWNNEVTKEASYQPFTINVAPAVRQAITVSTFNDLLSNAKNDNVDVTVNATQLDFTTTVSIGNNSCVRLGKCLCNWTNKNTGSYFKGANCVIFGGVFDTLSKDVNKGNRDRDGLGFILRSYNNTAIIGSECRNMNAVWNGDNKPDKVLLDGVTVTTKSGVRTYFGWVQGSNIVIKNCSCDDSMYEHVVRAGGVKKLSCYNNTFSNLDRRTEGVDYDTAKGVFTLHMEEDISIVKNKVISGSISVGPLGVADGTKTDGYLYATLRNVQILDNDCNFTKGDRLGIDHGASGVYIRGNSLVAADGPALAINPIDENEYKMPIDTNGDGVNDSYEMRSYKRPDGTYRHVEDVYIGPQLKMATSTPLALSISSTAIDVKNYSNI